MSLQRYLVDRSSAGYVFECEGDISIVSDWFSFLNVLPDRGTPQGGRLFRKTIGGTLAPRNLTEGVIKSLFRAKQIAWKGWHAYRRGLAKNLHALGVDEKIIQVILRYEDVGTTPKSYIQTLPETLTQAMAKIERKLDPCCGTCVANSRFNHVKLTKSNRKPT